LAVIRAEPSTSRNSEVLSADVGHAVAVQLRPVRPDELERLKEIRLRALLDAPGAFGSRYEDEVVCEPAAWLPWVTTCCSLVAEDDEGWRGLVRMSFEDVDRSVSDLQSMWVDPVRRGQGIAGRLLAVGVDWAREQGATSVRLGVVDGNSTAQLLYERSGFVLTGDTEPLRSDTTKTILFMSLRLGA
jgi:GNAT superfamily N-acetyltransferase